MRRRSISTITALVLLTGLSILVWNHLFPKQTALEFALGLERLPDSVEIIAEATDSWTDYVSHHSIRLNSADFKALLSGRIFMQTENVKTGRMEHEGYRNHLPPIEVDAQYEVHDSPPSGFVCKIYVNESRTEAYILYMAY